MFGMKNLVLTTTFAIIILIFAMVGKAQVLELGESELQGKKERPEAMTFISRARLQDAKPMPVWVASSKIKEPIDGALFRASEE